MKRILSIDDEPRILRCFEKLLNSRGYSIVVTTDPDEGLRMVREDPEIILAMLDVHMPKKNGFQIYRELREIRKIPVLFVTAYPRSFTAESDEVATMWQNEFADGTTDIVYKPLDLESLVAKVEGLIGKPEETGTQE